MKHLVYILCIALNFSLSAQVTIRVEQLPETTDPEATLYISGNFEGWTGGVETYALDKRDGIHSITLPKTLERLQFKFTLGTWETVECNADGSSKDNRTYVFDTPNDTLNVRIEGWDHLTDKQPKSTKAKNVKILAQDFTMSPLERNRRVWIYLPPGYEASKKKYPVLYMQDGQNLFDAETSYSGEWEVDETLNALYQDENLELIVVAVDNGGDKRLDEYSPWKHPSYGGGQGADYSRFLVNTLKPYIDANFRTLKGKEHTGIMGSSMGGLISYYAGLKYPEVFGKIGVYSPAFWFAPQVEAFTKTQNTDPTSQFYFLAGGKEGENAGYKEISQTVSDMNRIIEVLKATGMPSTQIQSKVDPEGQHNEALWRDHFRETILWLFPKAKTIRTFENAIVSDHELQLEVSDGHYLLKYYNAHTVETTFIPDGEVRSETPSHAVVLESTFDQVQYSENDSIIAFKTANFTTEIRKKPFQIRYFYNGAPLVSEKHGYRKTNAYKTLQFSISEDEVLYGGGARALGMNRRGHRLELYNKADYGYKTHSELMNYTMPIVASSKQYMLHFDNAPIGYLDLDSQNNNTVVYETISGRMRYQVVAGDSWLGLLDHYTDLTGKQPLPPRWALGNFSSRFGYHSQHETETTIQKFREEQIPVDAVILDLYWFGKDVQGTMGNLEVYKDSFPDMKGMIRKLEQQQVKTILITEPFILTTSKRWSEAVNANVLAKGKDGKPYTYDFYFGNTGLIDIYDPKGVSWFWGIYKNLINWGVKGLWGDLGEPEVHPSEVLHAAGTADEVHNTYGHDWARLVYEGYQRDFPNQRPFILMRAGYSGSQRFGLIPWSGDVSRSWGGLQSQPEIALQMGMQGVGYMHSDLGGFAGANLDDELYARWLQYGVFQPIYRPHAQEEVPSEPVFRAAKAKALAKSAIELRYQMLPYNYNLAFENSHTGAPLMRPLLFEASANEQFKTVSSTYLWGRDFLVTPVLESGLKELEVTFPAGSHWYDFYSDTLVKGGQKKTVRTETENIPTYVRGGAFLLMTEKGLQSTEAYTGNTLQLHYYPDPESRTSQRSYYNDDGLTPDAYTKGQFEHMHFSADHKEQLLTITLKNEIGSEWKAAKKQIELIVHNPPSEIRWVKIGRKKVNFKKENKTLIIPVIWDSNKTINLKIKSE